MGKLKHSELLAQTIGFNDDDLDANRIGIFSDRQCQSLRRLRMLWRIIFYAIVVACPTACLVAINDGIRRGDTIASRIGIIIFIFAFTGVLLIFCYREWKQYNDDVTEGLVQGVEGCISIMPHREKHGISFTITIQGETLTVNQGIFLAFKNGDPYAIYFSPNTRKLLSAEWLRSSRKPIE